MLLLSRDQIAEVVFLVLQREEREARMTISRFVLFEGSCYRLLCRVRVLASLSDSVVLSPSHPSLALPSRTTRRECVTRGNLLALRRIRADCLPPRAPLEARPD